MSLPTPLAVGDDNHNTQQPDNDDDDNSDTAVGAAAKHSADGTETPHVLSADRRYHAHTVSMTDFGSEDGNSSIAAGASGRSQRAGAAPSTSSSGRNRGGNVPGLTGPAGEPGLPPSRPTTSTTVVSTPAMSQHSNPARRGIASYATTSVGSAATSRPQTSGSKTHVPSLTSQAFFKPMSSQRLQAQRQQRNSAAGRRRTGAEQYQQPPVPPVPSPGLVSTSSHAPASRGTDVTERTFGDRTTANPSPDVAETVQSQSESTAPLRKPVRLQQLDTEVAKETGSLPVIASDSKSPRSFRNSFIMPNRLSRASNREVPQLGLEKLSSTTSSPNVAEPPTKIEVRREIGRNYQYFSGNTVFCWGGRLQNARDRPVNIATGILALLPAGLFFGYSGPWLWLHVSPAIPIVFAYVFLICLSSFIHASVSDPGILPRNLHPIGPSDPNEDPLTIGPPTTEWTMVVSAVSKSAAMEVPTKYCKSCNVWRPPRAHHCRVCDNCIETQDHHCVWLNNCVGRRNYRYFFAFVASATVTGLYLMAASLAHLLVWMDRNNTTFGRAINHWRVPFAMFIYGVLITPYPLSLTGYHLFLMARGETTREYLNSHKFLSKDRHRPFTQGSWIKNWAAVLVRPRPPTYLHFKQKHLEGDQRFGEGRGKRTAPLKSEYQGGRGVPSHGANGVEMQDIGTARVGARS